METSLQHENRMVLDVVQAALGLIPKEMTAISIVVDHDLVILHFAVVERSAQVDEDIEDLVSDVFALQDGPINIEARVFVGSPRGEWPGFSGRRVYLAKDF
ncbi:hypothetical protein ACFO1B_39615 [Dactylosporangium siamense]|uniref:Uncharacterized protein n=1 Tax=Dactylosporangium siamense TaxID=685454 RepID=A0A919UFS0_9ACTN|nr:hypothetical protein [Dactylosporangium siamense]GIG49900.1 hypothetical protein Dsi01nite_079410 [Dactylosporangium siamense]